MGKNTTAVEGGVEDTTGNVVEASDRDSGNESTGSSGSPDSLKANMNFNKDKDNTVLNGDIQTSSPEVTVGDGE